jgi:hypothetical protein
MWNVQYRGHLVVSDHGRTTMGRRAHGSGGSHPPGRSASPQQEPDLLADVRDLLAADHPLPLLTYVSGLLDAVEDPAPWSREAPETSLPELVDSFMAVDRIETTALLTVFAELGDDELLGRRILRDLAGRGRGLPGWLARLSPVTPVDARLVTHPLGAFSVVLVGARTGTGADITAVVEVDHTLGTVATDGFCYPGAVDVGAERLDDPDAEAVTIDLAEARARIDEAVETGRITVPPFETDTWPESRPLVEWLARQLPAGGRGNVRPEIEDAERAAIIRRFLASPHGRRHDHEDGRSQLEWLLWYGCDYGTGDPLTWSTAEVELLLVDWLPRKVIADVQDLTGVPDLLRDLIRFGHEERTVSDELTEDALAAVDEHEPEYQALIRSDRPQGPAALFAAMGMLDDEDVGPAGVPGMGAPTAMPGIGDAMATYFRSALARAEADVGGPDILDTLDTSPLPDEPLDWERVPAGAREPVGAVAELTDRWCDEVLGDVEVRTVCRRLVTDVAAADPGVFTGRGRVDTAAAAVAWIVGKANGLFDSWGADWSIGEMTAWFGVSGSPSQRARRMLESLGHDADPYQGIRLGSPRFLTSDRRRQLAEQRDVARAYLDAGVPPGATSEFDMFDDEDEPEDATWDDPWDDPWDDVGLAALAAEEVLIDHGADPAPAAPWRTPERLDVLAVGWFPPEEFAAAVERWPALADRIGSSDYDQYARVVQGTLIDLAREFGRRPVLVPLTTQALTEHAEHHQLEAAGWQARATLAAELDRQGEGVDWPPGRNESCWCGSGRKYKRCCGTVPSDPERRPLPADTGKDVSAYEIEVTLVGVSPRIWRRFQLTAEASFLDLHLALQAVCGWDNDHLFAFRTPDGTTIADAGFEDPFGARAPDAATVGVNSYFAHAERCTYEYDFGDGWLHELRVVGRITRPLDHRLRLLDGARAFPPEDCGGLPGYHACLEVAAGGADPDDRADWLGDWDPEAFDLEEVARRVEQ